MIEHSSRTCTRRRTRVRRAILAALSWGLFLAGSAAGVDAQPFTPPAGQPPAPPGGQPFVPSPGAPPPTLPQQKVIEVVVRGNQQIPASRILDAVSTKVNDPLNEEKLRNDVQAILTLGYFADAVVRLEPVPEGVRVIFLVVENPVVKAVAVKGNTVVSTPDILKALNVPEGQVLNTVAMRTGARAVEALYQDRGYVLARVSDASVDAEGVLTLTVAEGKIEAVKIDGLHKTKDYVVRRELLFKPGDVFNANTVNASLKRLFQLQYFSDVKAQPSPGTQPDTVDVTILVTEQRTAMVSFGAGYSTLTGILGTIAVRDLDFGGNGQTVGASYDSTALNGNNFAVTFHEPRFQGSTTAFDTQWYTATTIPTDYSLGLGNTFQYNMYQSGEIVTFTQPLDSIHSLTYGGKNIITTFGPPTFGTPPPASFVFTPGTVDAVILGAAQDTRNDVIFPTTGERYEILTTATVGGDFTFQKYDFDYQHAFPAGNGTDTAIIGHVHVGIGSQPLPIQEQFYLGGQTTLRGFAGGRFRGNEMALVQGEYRFPLSNLPYMKTFTGVTTILFMDAGTAEPMGTPLSLNVDYGIGMAIKTPVGLVRIDLGFGPEGSQFWVSTGALF